MTDLSKITDLYTQAAEAVAALPAEGLAFPTPELADPTSTGDWSDWCGGLDHMRERLQNIRWTDRATPREAQRLLRALSDLVAEERPSHSELREIFPKQGRPNLTPGVTRVAKTFRVHPETLRAIDEAAKATGQSAGQVVDGATASLRLRAGILASIDRHGGVISAGSIGMDDVSGLAMVAEVEAMILDGTIEDWADNTHAAFDGLVRWSWGIEEVKGTPVFFRYAAGPDGEPWGRWSIKTPLSYSRGASGPRKKR